MVKHTIDDFTIVEGVALRNNGSPTQRTGNCAPVTRIDCYQGRARMLRACIYFCPDGCTLEAPRVDGKGVIHLYCNTCQFPSTRELLRATTQAASSNAGQAVPSSIVYVYYNSMTDAGLHAGKDPFVRESRGLSL